MIELAFLVFIVMVMVVPTVLYQALGDQLERPGWVVEAEVRPGGPYRGHVEHRAVPVAMPWRVRGAVGLSFLFAVLGLLMAMPTLLGVACQWGVAMWLGVPGLALAMAGAAVGLMVLRRGPQAAGPALGVGLGQAAFGAWLLAVVVTVTDAQHGPVMGAVETGVAQVLRALGSHPRDRSWTIALAVDSGLGLLPVLYGTAALLHGLLLLATARAFTAGRPAGAAAAG